MYPRHIIVIHTFKKNRIGSKNVTIILEIKFAASFKYPALPIKKK
jgi:hypothetical protein